MTSKLFWHAHTHNRNIDLFLTQLLKKLEKRNPINHRYCNNPTRTIIRQKLLDMTFFRNISTGCHRYPQNSTNLLRFKLAEDDIPAASKSRKAYRLFRRDALHGTTSKSSPTTSYGIFTLSSESTSHFISSQGSLQGALHFVEC